MNPLPSLLILLTLSPALVFLIHILFARIFSKLPAQWGPLLSYGLGMVPMTILIWIFSFKTGIVVKNLPLGILYSWIVYSALACIYFHFFNMSETARRIKILYEIYQSGSLSRDQILSLYKTSTIIEIRLKRLLDTHQLILRDGVFKLNGRILYGAGLFQNFWRSLLKF